MHSSASSSQVDHSNRISSVGPSAGSTIPVADATAASASALMIGAEDDVTVSAVACFFGGGAISPMELDVAFIDDDTTPSGAACLLPLSPSLDIVAFSPSRQFSLDLTVLCDLESSCVD
eukprot:scaffold27045_cov35-Attheya_sp.AAC.1